MESKEALKYMYNWIYCCDSGTTYEDDVKLDEAKKIIIKDLEILETLKKYIVYDKEFNAIKCYGFVLTETHRKEDYEKTVRWLDGKD